MTEENNTEDQATTAARLQAGQARANTRIVQEREQARHRRQEANAIRRAERRERSIATDAEPIEARERNLISRSTLNKKMAMEYIYSFSIPQIRTFVVQNYTFLDDFFYASANEMERISVSYDELENKAKQIREIVNRELNKLDEYATHKTQQIEQIYHEGGIKLKSAEEAFYSTPTKFRFRLTSPQTNKWLKAMLKLDVAGTMETYLTFEGILPEETALEDIQSMLAACRNFNKFITRIRRPFYEMSNRLRDERNAERALRIKENAAAESAQEGAEAEGGEQSTEAPAQNARARARRQRTGRNPRRRAEAAPQENTEAAEPQEG